jgi:pimeloyl-ACP methyl ester carboxylesterase
MTIKFEEHGTGEPMVLLHAFPLSRKMWSPQAERFAHENVRVILPDLPGFGETPAAGSISTMKEMANAVADLLDHLEIEKALIGGLSMGGYTTFELFRMRPDLFKAIVFCDTAAYADTDEKRDNRFKLIEKINTGGTQPLIDEMLPNLIGETTKANDRELVSELTAMFADADPQGAVAALRGMAERRDNTDLLPTIDVPTLFIVGEEDRLTGRDVAEEMHAQVNGSQLAVIEKAGHFSNLENTDDFNRALSAFCRSVFR